MVVTIMPEMPGSARWRAAASSLFYALTDPIDDPAPRFAGFLPNAEVADRVAVARNRTRTRFVS
jgi:hypothetical protein